MLDDGPEMTEPSGATAKASSGGKKASIHSVEMAIKLLKVLAGSESELGLSEIGRRLGVAKSSVHRLAAILVEENMLEQNALNGKYRLGIGLLPLGTQVRRRMPVAAEARPYMVQLRAKTDETVSLAILHDGNVLYVRNLESPRAIRMGTEIGTEKPALAAAEGLAILAYQPKEMVDTLLAAGFTPRTPKTMTDPAKIRAELERIREIGYYIDDEGSEYGVRGVAVPIRGADGLAIAAIGVAGPVQRLSKGPIQRLLPAVVDAAAAISEAVGFRPAVV